MAEVAKTSEIGKPKTPPAAGQPAAEFQRDAAIVSELSAAGVLSVVIGKNLKSSVHPAGFKLYRDQLLKASGDPSDPLEAMMLEQIMIAHHRVLCLHAEAAQAETPELIEVLNSAASRLTAEFRRLCLAVREYRARADPRSVTLVKTQNVAGGDQKIALVDNRPNGVGPHPTESEPELLENRKALTHEKATLFDASVTGSKIPQIEAIVPRSPGEWKNAIGL